MSLKKDIGEVQHTPSVKQGITTDYSSSIGADSWDLTPINNALNAASGLVQQATTIATERKVNAYTRQTTDLYDRYGKVEEQLADTVKQIELGHQDENTLADYYKTRERLLNGDAQGSIRGLATQIRQIKARFRSDHPRLTAHFDKVDSNFGDFDIAKREKDSIDKAREKTFLEATSMAMSVPEYEIYQHKLATAKALEAQQSIAKSSGIIDVRDTALKTSVGLWTATALTEWRKKLNSGRLTDQEVAIFRSQFENEFSAWKQEETGRLVRDGATMEGVDAVLQLDREMVDAFFDASGGEAMMDNLIRMQTQDSILATMRNFPEYLKASGFYGGNLDKVGEFMSMLPILQEKWGTMGELLTKAQIQSGGPEVQNMLLWMKMNSTPEAKGSIVANYTDTVFGDGDPSTLNPIELDTHATLTMGMVTKGAVIPEEHMNDVVSSLFRAEGSLAFSDMVDPVKAATARRNNPSIAMEWRNQSTAAAEKNLDEIADYFAYNQAGAGKLVALGKDKRGDLTRSASGRAIAGTFFSINGADGKEDKTMSYHVKKNLRMLNEKAQALYNLDPALAEEFIEETVNSAVLEKYTGSKRDKAYKLLDEAARYENRPLSIYERDRVEAKQDYLNIADSLKQQAYSILEGDMNVAQAEAATAQFDPTVDDTPPTNLGGPEENPSKGKGMDDLSNVENVELPTKMPYSEVKVDPKKSDAFARKTAEWTEQMNSSDDSKTQKVYEDVSRLLEQMGMKSLPRVETVDEMRQVLDLNGIYESITQGGNLEADLAKQGKVEEEIVVDVATKVKEGASLSEKELSSLKTQSKETEDFKYTVSGDTDKRYFGGIAKKFGLSVDELVEMNKDTVSDPSKIKDGQVFKVPTQAAVEAKALLNKANNDAELKKEKDIVKKDTTLLTMIKEDEGLVSKPYWDVKQWAAGYGHKLTADEIKKYPEGTDIPQEVIDNWLIEDIVKARRDAEKAMPTMSSMPIEAQHVLYNLAFQTGEGGIKAFTGLIEALESKDYSLAIKELIWTDPDDESKGHTDIYKSTRSRTDRHIAQLTKLIPTP